MYTIELTTVITQNDDGFRPNIFFFDTDKRWHINIIC